MCCEEHHICLSCNQLLASYIDRCAGAAAVRDPGTEFGTGIGIGMHVADSSWCPETEWIVEQFLHDVDDGCCPHCSRHDDDQNFRTVDHLSGEIMHPPMLLSAAAEGRGSEGAGADDDSGGAISPASGDNDDDDDEGGKVARRGWRLRVRKLMVDGTRLMGSKRDGAMNKEPSSARELADGTGTAKAKGSSFGGSGSIKAVRFPYRVLE